MAVFTDQNEREWRIELDAFAIGNVREACSIDLANPAQLATLADDPVRLVKVLWELCREHAESRNIAARSFGAALAGDALERAAAALEAAVLAFIPRRQREALTKALAVRTTAQELAEARRSTESLDKIKAAMTEGLHHQFERMLTQLRSASSSPASSE